MTGKLGLKPLKPVQRDAKGRLMAGHTANPGGVSAAQCAARDALGLWLCADAQLEKGKAAYLQLLEEGNPVIVKDFMDRVAGKVKESISITDESERPLFGVAANVIIDALRGAKP